MMPQCILVCLAATTYTVMRYVVFGTTGVENLPAFLLNKALSLTAVACLLAGILSRYSEKEGAQKFWYRSTTGFAFIHVLLSFAVLTPAYLPKFFDAGRLTLAGELSILGGTLAAFCYFRFQYYAHHGNLLTLVPLSLALHLVPMGFSGWMTPEKWHGGLPPISLLAFLLVLACFGFLLHGTGRSHEE